MRRLLKELMPWIVVFYCWAHQINLIVGDFFKLHDDCLRSVAEALDIVKWFNNHGAALDLLRGMQISVYDGRVLALILPVITRWTAHYQALRRLLQIYEAVRACVLQNRQKLLVCAGPKAEMKRTAERILLICESREFWERITK